MVGKGKWMYYENTPFNIGIGNHVEGCQTVLDFVN